MPEPNHVTIIGGGISGLACAFRLQQLGLPFTLLESEERVGGLIGTVERDGFFFDLPLQCVDRRIGGDDLTRQTDVAPRQRVDRARDLLLGETAHLRDHLRELDEVCIEDSGGVLGDVHDISAGAGDSIGVRTA